ncbi:MAG: hypothetical protein IJS15_05215, partial [Victivallales bacterium]|nr:hypothetical protein [Victivallales bacterium]
MAEYTNVVISGTTRRVNSGDTYISTTVSESAGLMEMVAGRAYDTTLINDGRLWMQGGAYASSVTAGGGSCRISAFHTGTILEDVHIDSSVNATGTWRLDIRAGVLASNAVVSGAAIQLTGSNAVIRNLVMDEGAMMYAYNYASAYNVTIESANAAQLRLYNHGYIDNITISKGNLQIFGQGFAENVHIYDKAQIWSSGTDGAGSANLVTVYNGGTLEVLTSGTASNVTVGGVMTVDSAAVASGVTALGDNIDGGTGSAYILVANGGRIVDGVVSGARVDVSSGGTAENIVVSGGYGLVVREATVSNCSAVGAMGDNYIFIQSNSILSGGYFADNGRLRLENGCSALDVVFDNCAADSNFIIGDGAYTSNYILRGANTGIEMRGTALNGTVSGGIFNFTSGGTLTGLTVSSGGNFNFGTTGDITDVTVKAGGQLNGAFSWDYDFTLDTIANGSAVIADAVVVSGTQMNVGNDGTVSGTTVNEGGAMTVTDYGKADSTTMSGGTMTVTNYGKADCTTVIGGVMAVTEGGTVDSTTVSGGVLT